MRIGEGGGEGDVEVEEDVRREDVARMGVQFRKGLRCGAQLVLRPGRSGLNAPHRESEICQPASASG